MTAFEKQVADKLRGLLLRRLGYPYPDDLAASGAGLDADYLAPHVAATITEAALHAAGYLPARDADERIRAIERGKEFALRALDRVMP